MRLAESGFSLLEMLMALAISAIVMVSLGRFLPLLLEQNLQLQQRVQLQLELEQLAGTLEKALRRAGYCRGECTGSPLTLAADSSCVLLRWDGNSNGQWEGVGHNDSDFYGYRLRNGQLEMQRGVDECHSSGWERMTDPAFMQLERFHIRRHQRHLQLELTGHAGQQQITLVRVVEGLNL